MDEKKGLSQPFPWALDDEEMKAAGADPAPSQISEQPVQAAPFAEPEVKNRSTVVRSVWDPMRDEQGETVDEWLPQQRGNLFDPNRPEPELGKGTGVSPLVMGICTGILAGLAAGALWGSRLLYGIIGLAAGTVLGLLGERRKKNRR
ncbi:MAG: hypothetical protein PHE47_04975 [Oscillospiraceae bacterium]|nr:hypothetical protein [Oscillospiraceae bacterium]